MVSDLTFSIAIVSYRILHIIKWDLLMVTGFLQLLFRNGMRDCLISTVSSLWSGIAESIGISSETIMAWMSCT